MITPEFEAKVEREAKEAVAFIDKWLEDYATEQKEIRATIDAVLEDLAHKLGLDELAAAFNDGDKAKRIIEALDGR
jgi:hypothetical protein